MASSDESVGVVAARIITLSFSRYMFVWPTFLQTTAAVCEGLDRAFRFFGAMPRTLIPDNKGDDRGA
jgi:transposase